MSYCKPLGLCLIILLFLYNLVLCENNKNNNVPSNRKSLNSELTKNQFDHVYIKHENISELTKDLLWELTMVKELEIEYCNVHNIEKGAFNHLSAMKKLSLKHNLLEEIKKGVFDNLRIKELDLSYNQIKIIEDMAFSYMVTLERLNLKNNKIEVYNNLAFNSNMFLQHINFENNLIKALPEYILSRFFYSIFSLEVIFSHNKIKKIDENAFRHMGYFKKLHLDHNAIKTIENRTFSVTGEIDDLRLDHNEIVCTTFDIKSVKKISVDANPWDSECLQAFKAQKTSWTNI